jgi:mono/diheme cytochrome c family protein
VVNNCLQCHSARLLGQQRLTPKQWAAVVKKMIGWGAPVEPENVEALVRHLSSRYSPGLPPVEPPSIGATRAAAALAPLRDGAYRSGNAGRGKALFEKACASCHAVNGLGSPTGVNLVDRPLLWRASDFAEVVRQGRGRMPAFNAFSNDEVASILSHLRSLLPP